MAIMTGRFKASSLAWLLALCCWLGWQLGPSGRAPVKILALGTSLTQGYGLPPGTEFTTQLQAALKGAGHRRRSSINAGVSGDTIAGGLSRLDWSLADHPDAAIMELGSNDMLRGIPPAETEKNLRAILAKLQKDHIPVLLTGMQAQRNLGADYVKEFDAIYPRLAKDYPCDLLSLHPGRRGAQPQAQPGRRHASQSGGREDHRGAHSALCEKAGRRDTQAKTTDVQAACFRSAASRCCRASPVLCATCCWPGRWAAASLSDAFFVAFLFPNYFRTIFGEGTINPAFLPRYAALHAKGEARGGGRIRRPDLLLADGGAGRASGAGDDLHALRSSACWRRACADNPSSSTLTVSLARITFPYLILTLVAVQLSAMLNAIEKFWAAAAWSNLQNLAMIATLLAWHWFPNAAYAAAWGVFAGRRGAADLHALGGRARRAVAAPCPGRAGRPRSRNSSWPSAR